MKNILCHMYYVCMWEIFLMCGLLYVCMFAPEAINSYSHVIGYTTSTAVMTIVVSIVNGHGLGIDIRFGN